MHVTDLRLERGLSRRELARMAGLSPEAVRRAEAGEPVRPVTLAKIAIALQLPPRELYDRLAASP